MKINLKDIIKIQHLEMEIFEEEDQDYPDNRIIRNKERAIFNTLNKITMDWDKREQIRDCIYKNMWNTEDLTFKPICDSLRSLGYEIVGGKNAEETI